MRRIGHRLQMYAVRALRGALRPLPEGTRAAVLGWIGRRLVFNTPSLRKRIDDNLRLVFPELTASERVRLTGATASKTARNMFDMLDNERLLALKDKMQIAPMPGWTALKAAQSKGQGTILIGGHYGRFDAVRAALLHRGIEVGAVYRPQNNPHHNAELVHHFEKVGGPMVPRGRAGMRKLIKHLRSGGVMAILIDQKTGLGVSLDFMGHPAMTSTDIADLALRYDLPLIPAYALRTDDGTHFRIELEAPIPPSDPETMTQEVNDSLARRIRQDPTEWYWLHRRWAKPIRQINAEAARQSSS
ncbi:MAG: lysophospholipid acyltransferase family protein [Pseudomonadota bacterium]